MQGLDEALGMEGALFAALAVGAVLLASLGLLVRSRSRSETYQEQDSGQQLEAVAAPKGVWAAMSRTREQLARLFMDAGPNPDLERLEETLLLADVGLATTQRLIAAVGRRKVQDLEGMQSALKEEMLAVLGEHHAPLRVTDDLWVVLVVGVNGSGKTTTIGKLAARLRGEGRKVMLAAADTYRAAAAEQLEVWAERTGVDIVRHQEGADPGAVAYDALEAAQARGCDVVIIDTAGRLQTTRPLMEQLSKVRRVVDKKVPGAPHETLLVVDGTMGQNALSQGRQFNEATPLTGAVVTKLDGTARGGMVLALAGELQLPVKLIGVGEQLADLRDFEPASYVDALF